MALQKDAENPIDGARKERRNIKENENTIENLTSKEAVKISGTQKNRWLENLTLTGIYLKDQREKNE